MRRILLGLCCALAVVGLTLTGCGKSEPLPGAGSASPGASRSTSTRTASSKAATEQQAEEFARKMEEAFLANNISGLSRLIDWETMAQRATKNLGSAELQKGMRMGLVSGSQGEFNIFNEMRRTGGDDPTYKFVNSVEEDGQRYVWFRVSGDSGINYHRFTVVDQGGRVRANDLYLMLSGESLAETWRRLMLPTVQEESKNWLQKLTTSESEYYRNHHVVDEMVASMKRANPHAALAAYQRLPESVRKEKFLLLLRYQAASAADNIDEVVAAAADMKRHHPSDNCLDLIMVDMYIYQEDFDSALACIDRIDQAVGIDPYLDAMRGGILVAAQRFDEARAKYERCLSQDPECVDAYWGMIALANATQDYDMTYDYLGKIESQFEMTWNDIRNEPEYAGFVASPQGKKWLAEHGF